MPSFDEMADHGAGKLKNEVSRQLLSDHLTTSPLTNQPAGSPRRFQLSVTLIQAKGLPAVDKSLLSRKASSDPRCSLSLSGAGGPGLDGKKEAEKEKTKNSTVKKKNLKPVRRGVYCGADAADSLTPPYGISSFPPLLPRSPATHRSLGMA